MGRTKPSSFLLLWRMSAWEELIRNCCGHGINYQKFCGPFKSTWGKKNRHNHFGACVVLYCTEHRERTDSQSSWKELSHNLYEKDYVPIFMKRTESQSLWKELNHNLYEKN